VSRLVGHNAFGSIIGEAQVEIRIVTGRGVGATRLSAFDAALWDAGLGDYNLIYLSSVIPSGSNVVEQAHTAGPGQVGWKLYCVLSVGYLDPQGAGQAWVGLGWAHRPNRGGVFIEEAGTSRLEVSEKIGAAFGEMAERRGDIGCLHMRIVDLPPAAPYSCAVVVAVYDAQAWCA
jgi:arginine decarboxylase